MRGFSLIELSIVLVIVGLIVGGIVGGRALVRQSELQQIVREVSGLKTALNAFKNYYDAMPGDFARASEYWGVWDNSAVTGAQNGNGDNHWEEWTCYEGMYALRHLSLAEMVPGGPYPADPSQPKGFGLSWYPSQADGTGYGFCWHHPYNLVAEDAFNYISYGSASGDYPHGGVVLAKEAAGIDKKIDDGLAGEGEVHAIRAGSAGCTDVGWQSGSAPTYQVSDTANKCFMMFKIGAMNF